MKTREQVIEAMHALSQFIGNIQLKCLKELITFGEERGYFRDKLCELAEIVRTMAKTYEQDGKGKDAVVYLHYFTPNADAWITEKKPTDGAQDQAFGYASLNGWRPEMGYISIAEWLENGAELDLHFTPKPVREVAALNDNAEMCVSAVNTVDNVGDGDDY